MVTKRTPIAQLADLVRANVTRGPANDPDAASVHFFGVKRDEGSELTGEQLVEAIRDAETGYYGDMTPDRWKAGPSYIELGAWIGDQGVALALMGLGKLLGIWDVFTPATVGMPEKEAERAAGVGYVLVMPTPGPMFP